MKKSQRGTPRRRKRAPAKKIRKAITAGRARTRAYMEVLPPRAREQQGDISALPATLTSDPLMVSTFVGMLTLDDKQIAALRRPVAPEELEWRAAVQNGEEVIPYLSHNGYRERLDAAFGLGGWGMVPVGMPKQQGEDFIYVPYALVIGGVPRIYTWGEQQKHKMTYGDALEGAKSNAITRCGKELGIARELWNRGHVAELLRAKRGGKPPQKGEDPKHRYGTDAKADEPITDAQRIRLWTIVKRTGRPKTEVAMWLTARYNIEDSHTIKRRDYDAIVTAIENPGPLPMPEEA